MYLKRLKLRNFKSFSGATEIPFQSGFTGVAGPNGMGKSNISDAILFVLGPTSSKALRAERLTHLFFNGGSSKKAATECEVSLVFDNSDHLLPVEAGEVEVTRYVKLAPGNADGYYSYFYVNGKRSTQTEIDSLLSHARLSGDGYNLVQQGDVNKVVTMGPIPRRGLVERLAGISQYRRGARPGRGEADRPRPESRSDPDPPLRHQGPPLRARRTAPAGDSVQAAPGRQTPLRSSSRPGRSSPRRAGGRHVPETGRRRPRGARTPRRRADEARRSPG